MTLEQCVASACTLLKQNPMATNATLYARMDLKAPRDQQPARERLDTAFTALRRQMGIDPMEVARNAQRMKRDTKGAAEKAEKEATARAAVEKAAQEATEHAVAEKADLREATRRATRQTVLAAKQKRGEAIREWLIEALRYDPELPRKDLAGLVAAKFETQGDRRPFSIRTADVKWARIEAIKLVAASQAEASKTEAEANKAEAEASKAARERRILALGIEALQAKRGWLNNALLTHAIKRKLAEMGDHEPFLLPFDAMQDARQAARRAEREAALAATTARVLAADREKAAAKSEENRKSWIRWSTAFALTVWLQHRKETPEFVIKAIIDEATRQGFTVPPYMIDLLPSIVEQQRKGIPPEMAPEPAVASGPVAPRSPSWYTHEVHQAAQVIQKAMLQEGVAAFTITPTEVNFEARGRILMGGAA